MKKTLVFGASLKPNRYSNMALLRLEQYGHEVKAYGIKEGLVNDIEIENELISYDDIDTVTMYLNPKVQEAYYDHILSLRPKRVIFNPGTENPEFYKILDENNINYEVACTLVLLGTNQY